MSRTVRKIPDRPTDPRAAGVRGVRDRPTDYRPVGGGWCLTRAIVVCTRSLKILLTKSPWAGKPNVCSTPPAFSFVNNCVIYIPLYTLGKYGGCHTAVSLITRVRRVRDRPTDLGPPAVRPLHHRPTDLGGGVRDLGWQLSKTPKPCGEAWPSTCWSRSSLRPAH